ncbi:16S rRNA (guanine(527)-N(7))-methyltransferase RsmG [Micromonospora polyrhachis]|uniref:Ribosomal RNA small subunit methyltransferase G n=1 Tax=Micromonospora polyrhachis TaxID=1282883 RepID=A0A7W7WPV4_9ACTN|nr:16S rRNA (guanine(527)-N(7))-methyltransferase RsmG [Micromonospora polyrhachis]MBB4959134.1 16S rRNA (guanine527-N7)-methyltransferase [Micromonospora polyrhachis]
MTNESAADAVFGPGGTPPGPSAVPSQVVPLPPELTQAARTLFGERLPLAERYAELLATDGVVRGLIGPREAPRIWERHLINCAAVAELLPPDCSVVDVGSGAGLPGLVLAVARPDLSVTLIEPLARRTAFLAEAVALLGLDRSVTVLRARAEEVVSNRAGSGGLPPADVVTARAVAPLDRLAGWCLPLAAVGGRLLALKGASAADEVTEHHAAVERLGGGPASVRRCGVGVIDPPTTVVEIVRERAVEAPKGKATRGKTAKTPQRETRSTRAERRSGPPPGSAFGGNRGGRSQPQR